MLARLGERQALTNAARFAVEVGPWISRGRYDPRERVTVDCHPPATALSDSHFISIDLTGLGDAKSTGDENIFLRLHLPRPYLENLRYYTISIYWKDQGWGNRKGRVGIADGVCHSLTPELADHDLSQVTFSAPFQREQLGTLLSASAEQPQASANTEKVEATPPLKFFYVVGGGGGHSIVIRSLKLKLYCAEFQLRPILNLLHILRTLVAAPKPTSKESTSSDESGRIQDVKRSWLTIVRRQLDSEEVMVRLASMSVGWDSEESESASYSYSDEGEEEGKEGEEDEEEEKESQGAEEEGTPNYESLATWYLSLAMLPYDVQRRTLEYLYIPMENLLPNNPASWKIPLSDHLKYL